MIKDMQRLSQQISFILEMDKLKTIIRQTVLIDKSRKENDAEHSWHLALMAITLKEYANDENIDILKVIKMVLVHDLVEIDAGDTFLYDETGNKDKEERELKAADRIFAILPHDIGQELRTHWEEFEEAKSSEAKFARCLDRLQPLLHNYHTQGQAWQDHNVSKKQVIERNQKMAEGSKDLWQYAEEFIQDAVKKGYLNP